MLNIFFCLGAFLCFFLYDWNETQKKKGVLHFAFMAGCLFWALATVRMLYSGWREVNILKPVQFIWILLSGIFLILLVYSLFFALPVKETYGEKQIENPPVCDEGVYALCRHPGYLWYFGFYLFSFLIFPTLNYLVNAVLLCVLNFIYIWVEDKYFFPSMFSNYEDYKERVPFLIPTKTSIHKCFSTLLSRRKVEL